MKVSGSRVLIGFAESLAAIETAWMLRAAGHEVHAFTRRGARPPLARSRGVRVHEVTAPAEDSEATAIEVAMLAHRLRAAVVLPLDDEAVWVLDRAVAEMGPVRVAGPTGELARLALDKRLQLEAARGSGLVVPETVVLDPGATGFTLPASGSGWVVKPALAVETRGRSLGRGDVRIAGSAYDVERVVAQAQGPVLVQPRITGVGTGVFGFATQGTVHALSGHRRIRMMNPAGSGSSACQSVEPAPEIAEPVAKLVASTGWHGLFMVELLAPHDGSTPVFMELNGRTWGSMALARRRGLDYPVWAVDDAVAGSASVTPSHPLREEPIRVRHVGRELVHVLFVLRGPRPGPDPEWPRRGRTLREVFTWRRGDRLYNHRPGELRTLLADSWQTCAQQVSRGLGRRSR